ncbi:MAG: tyrosine-type recombinase/integrase, partial [Chloroflexota bacterium]
MPIITRTFAARNTDLPGLRDTAIVTVLMMTGLRAAELCALTVEDVFATVDGAPVVRVRHGKGNKRRLVPLGDNAARVHGAVRRWL